MTSCMSDPWRTRKTARRKQVSSPHGNESMTVEELIAEVVALLQREGRVSYRMLKRRFSLDDDYLEDLKEEVIYAKRLAVDEDSKVLVWTGGGQVTAPRTVTTPRPQSPASYTPPHLAERILAEQAAMETRGATD